jgi:hypothetical protein
MKTEEFKRKNEINPDKTIKSKK